MKITTIEQAMLVIGLEVLSQLQEKLPDLPRAQEVMTSEQLIETRNVEAAMLINLDGANFDDLDSEAAHLGVALINDMKYNNAVLMLQQRSSVIVPEIAIRGEKYCFNVRSDSFYTTVTEQRHRVFVSILYQKVTSA